MAEPDYTNLAVALESARISARVEADDTEGLARLSERLELTTGTNPASVRVFRPFYVAARYLKQRPSVLAGGEGATFRDPTTAINDLLDMQAGIDERLGLTVPTRYSASSGTGYVAWGPLA